MPVSITFSSKSLVLPASIVACLGCALLGPEQPIVAQLEVPSSVRVGEPVLIILRIANQSGDSTDIEMISVPPNLAFNPIVRTTSGAGVWQRFTDPYAAVGVRRRMGPAETIEYRVIWDQVTLTGAKVAPGTYRVVNSPGLYFPGGKELRVASRTLRIVP